MRRAKFVGKYGNLRNQGFEYSNHSGKIYYLYKNTTYTELMIKREYGLIFTEQACTAVLDQILELIDTNHGVIPDVMYWDKESKKVSLTTNCVHWRDMDQDYVKTYIREHKGFPPYDTTKLHLPKIDMRVIYDMYRKGDIILVEDEDLEFLLGVIR